MSYIYVMQDDGLPGLVQIGMTDDNPEVRAQELSNITGALGHFTVARQWQLRMPRSMSGAYLPSSALITSSVRTRRAVRLEYLPRDRPDLLRPQQAAARREIPQRPSRPQKPLSRVPPAVGSDRSGVSPAPVHAPCGVAM